MSLQAQIIFSGLIALALDQEIPTDTQREPKWETTSSFDVYLLHDPVHVPEMLIPKANVLKHVGPGSCERGHECAQVMAGDWYQTGPCRGSFDHYVWCLREYLVVVVQPSHAVAKYYHGSRPAADERRHLEYRTPKEMSQKLGGREEEYTEDISWLPEIAKIRSDVTLKKDLDAQVTSKMVGLRGKIIPVGVKDRVWDWCDWSDDGCKESPGRKYDQAFAEAAAVSLDLETPAVFLLPRSGEKSPFRIGLKASPNDKPIPIRVLNLPPVAFAKLHPQPKDGWCIAKHFGHFFNILESKSERLPYCKATVPDCGSSGLRPFSAPTDSFCPPVIVKKP